MQTNEPKQMRTSMNKHQTSMNECNWVQPRTNGSWMNRHKQMVGQVRTKANECLNATKGEDGHEWAREQANRGKCGCAHMGSGEGGHMCNISGGSCNNGSCSMAAVVTTTMTAAAGVAAATSLPAAAGTGGSSTGAAAGAGTRVAAGANGNGCGSSSRGPTTWPFSSSPLYLFINF